MNKGRSRKTEIDQRVLTIQGWMIESVPYSLIVQQILAKGWCQSDRHAKRLVAAARDKWLEHENDNIDEMRKLAVIRLQNLRRSLTEKHRGTPEGIRAMVSVEKEIIKILGLAAPVRHEVTGKGGEPIKSEVVSVPELSHLTFEQLLQLKYGKADKDAN